MMIKRHINCCIVCLTLFAAGACRDGGNTVLPSEIIQVADSTTGEVKGFFLLNEGNMGSNKATLDYFDYESGEYHRNIFAERNPGVVKELGDVGNDIKIYGDRMYIAVNCSNLVEALDLNARYFASAPVPNCRYLAFDGRYVYVSSYAGPTLIDPNARLGYIARIDTATLRIVDTCVVGYQPEEMTIADGKLYVANSGGYRTDNYDNTVSVVDLTTFRETAKIPTAINLHRVERDARGYIWVSSRGDYSGQHSELYVIDPATESVVDSLNVPVSEMALAGDSLYVVGVEYNSLTAQTSVSYTLVNTRLRRVVSQNFITDGSDSQIVLPYCVAVNPETREVLLSDARDYVTPGKLYCFTPDGRKKWEIITGDIPAHIVFTRKQMN